MKRLPPSELELMMIIWHAKKPVTRIEIENALEDDRNISPTTILSFLSRLQEKGFVEVTKSGKNNIYRPIIKEEDYLKKESGMVVKHLFHNSVTNFVSSLADGGNLTEKDIEELQEFLNQKKYIFGKKDK